ncbi:MAG: hypothetical protein HY241_00070 [Actinobacteria bacterium]|nr:hypothetical protein [Actinomycetota bacterium]
MSKERARRRAVRLAEGARRAEEARVRSDRLTARRRRRDRLRRRLRGAAPVAPGQRWSRRTRGQRGMIAAVLAAVAVLVWSATDSWGPRIAVLLAATVVTPAVVTLFLDRSSR